MDGNNNSSMYICQFIHTRNVFFLISVSATVLKTLCRWGSNNNRNSERNYDNYDGVGLLYLGIEEYDYDFIVYSSPTYSD